MSNFYQYDTRPASAASQIMTLERLLEEAENKCDQKDKLIAALEREVKELRRAIAVVR